MPKEKFVAAGGGLQFIFGIGAISGPIICSLFMNWFDINGLFIFLIIAHIIIGIFGIYRMNVRAAAENPDSTYTSVPATITPAGLELDPDTPETLDNNQAEQSKVWRKKTQVNCGKWYRKLVIIYLVSGTPLQTLVHSSYADNLKLIKNKPHKDSLKTPNKLVPELEHFEINQSVKYLTDL